MEPLSDRTLIDLTVPSQGVVPGSTTGPRGVAQLSAEAPAAVLMVDLALRSVVYANRVAEQLAPGVVLPVGVEDWSDAAALRDPDGAELSETDHPLTRVARSQPVAGQAVSAARATEMGSRREPLWVVALPMADAPMLAGHALVVFLPVSEREHARAAATATAVAAQSELHEAAVLATGLSFTVADARALDLPLVWVNPAFTATTGYSFEESVGRNCRFLQGPATDPAARTVMGEALSSGQDITVTLLNYRKDGTAFWNQLSMSPIRDAAGALTHFVGIQSDVTARVVADAERDRALAAERAARTDAEDAHARLHLLAEVSSQLSGTLDAEQAVARLAELVVPVLGDFSMVSLLHDSASALGGPDAPGTPPGAIASARERSDAHRDLHDVAWWHRDADQREVLAELAAVRMSSLTEASGISRAYTSGRPVVVTEGATPAIQAVLAPGSAHRLIGRLAPESVAVFPLRGRGRTVGVLTVWRRAEREPFTAEEVALGEDLTARAGLALDSARLYRQQRELAEGLQRSLLTLTQPLEPRHAEVAVRYVAAAEAAQVGGDWYDAFLQPGGAAIVVIGDVIGHDTQAAAAMAQVRSLVRALGAVGDEGPASVLARTDQVMATLQLATTATAFIARLEPGPQHAPADTTGVRWSNAGHPPAMVIDPSGAVSVLDADEPDLLLGVDPTCARQERSVQLPAGAMVLLYTDGLVERRGQSLDDGLDHLRAVLADLATHDLSLQDLTDQVLARMLPPRPEDDVALVAVRLHRPDRPDHPDRPERAGPAGSTAQREPASAAQREPDGLAAVVGVDAPGRAEHVDEGDAAP